MITFPEPKLALEVRTVSPRIAPTASRIDKPSPSMTIEDHIVTQTQSHQTIHKKTLPPTLPLGYDGLQNTDCRKLTMGEQLRY